MGQKVMFEVTQPVVSGNEVQVPSGYLYASMDEVPDYVQVKPVIVDVPDAEPKAADKPSAKTQAKA
jgi:hypothetical protein